MENIVLKMILSLAAVLGLMYVVLVLMKRFVAGGTFDSSANVEVEVLGARTLHPKRSVYVLRILDKVIVVGATETTIQMLTEITDPERLQKLDVLERASTPRSSKRSWFGWGRADDETIQMPFARLIRQNVDHQGSAPLKSKQRKKVPAVGGIQK